jgi:hypothetical protein
MATQYAWSEIRVGEAKHDQTVPGKTTVIKFGDTVTADKVGGEEALQQMVEAGSVRDTKPPDMPDSFQGSPIDFVRAKREEEDEELLMTTGGSIFAPSETEVLLGEATLTTGKDKMPADEGGSK